jgi:hypothetical protein
MPARYKRCQYCGRFFKPDHRHPHDQKSCKREDCRHRRKAEAQKQWLERNPECFHGRYINTKTWRENHPVYQKQRRAQLKSREIQDTIPAVIAIKSIHLLKPGEWFGFEIQDAMPIVPLYDSTRYRTWRGGEIQDSIMPPAFFGYFSLYGDTNRKLSSNYQRYGCLHSPL